MSRLISSFFAKNMLIAILFLLSFNVKALNPNDFVITRVTAPYFVVDGNNPSVYNKAYVGFEVKNISNTTTYLKLRFSIASLTTSFFPCQPTDCKCIRRARNPVRHCGCQSSSQSCPPAWRTGASSPSRGRCAHGASRR